MIPAELSTERPAFANFGISEGNFRADFVLMSGRGTV
jgi:hypothetical protein